MLDEYGVRLNVLGRVEMLPENVRESVRVTQEMTKNNDKCASSDHRPRDPGVDDEFFKVHPEPLYALYVEGRDNDGGAVCRTGKGGRWPKRYGTSVCVP